MSSSASVPARSRWRVRLPSAARVDVDATALRATAIEAVLVVAGFAALAVIATWPVSRDFSSWITAPVPGNDQLGYLFDFRYAAEHGLPVIRDYIQTDVAVPFGRPASAAANLTLLGTLLPAVLITKLAGAIAAYNVMTLTGLSLSGAAMYLLVRWLGLGRGPAVWAGAVFVLFPYHLFAATAFVTIVQYQALPLVLMALVAWTVRPRLASGAAVVAADALCWLTFPYFGAMATVMTAVGLVVAASVHAGTAGWLGAARRLGGIVAGLIGVIAVPLAVIAAINAGGATGTIVRSPAELAQLGAEISDYVIPPRTSGFLAGIVGDRWLTLGSIGGERLEFVGWVTAIAALAGVVAGLATRRSLPERQRALLAMGIPMLVVLVAISLRSPYDVLGHQVTFPSRVLFEAFDFVRAPGRFVIAAMVPLCALGALGLHVLGRRLGVAGRGALVAGAIVFSCAELALGALPLPITPPTWLGSAPAEDQPAWRWLEAHPGGAVMDYPQVGNTAVSRYYMYGWAVHHHPVVDAVNNAGDPNGEFLRTVRDPRPVRVPAILAGAGVRYALLNQWAYAALGMTMPRAMPDGFTRVATFPDGSQIWRVDARPSAAQLYFTPTGFDPEQVSWDGHHVINRRVLRGTGVVRVRVARAGTYLARFRADPLGAPATVTVSGASGSATVRVARPRAVSVPVTLPEGTSDIRVSGSPGPTPVQMSPWVLDGPR